MVIVRRETPTDISAVRSVNQLAFGNPREAGLVEALRKRGGHTLSLIAVANDVVAGHILFTPVSIGTTATSRLGVGLGPMAVLPDYQRQGIGSRLVERGIADLQRAGHPFLVVLGHPQYYPRLGFVPASDYGLTCEFAVPDEAFTAMELGAGALAECRGIVRYESEFSAV